MTSLNKQSTNESEVIEKIAPIKIEEPAEIKREASAMLKCQVCDKPLKSKKSLNVHINNIHLGVKVMYSCPLCHLNMSKDSILGHMESIHAGQKQESKVKKMPTLEQKVYYNQNRKERRQSKEENKRLCPLCEKVFTGVFVLRKHVTAVHLNTKFQCAICGKVLKCIDSLKRHTTISHRDDNSKLYPCNICHQELTEKSKLKRHINTIHLGLKTFRCEICGMSFGHSFNLKSHVKIVHEKIKPFECQICSHKFGVKLGLKQHMQRHKVASTLSFTSA